MNSLIMRIVVARFILDMTFYRNLFVCRHIKSLKTGTRRAVICWLRLKKTACANATCRAARASLLDLGVRPEPHQPPNIYYITTWNPETCEPPHCDRTQSELEPPEMGPDAGNLTDALKKNCQNCSWRWFYQPTNQRIISAHNMLLETAEASACFDCFSVTKCEEINLISGEQNGHFIVQTILSIIHPQWK